MRRAYLDFRFFGLPRPVCTQRALRNWKPVFGHLAVG